MKRIQKKTTETKTEHPADGPRGEWEDSDSAQAIDPSRIDEPEEDDEPEPEIEVGEVEAADDGAEAPPFDPATWRPTVCGQPVDAPRTLRQAVKLQCRDCSSGSRRDVRCCIVTTCPIYGYRLGKSPFRAKRVYTDEQRAAMNERIVKMQAARRAKADETKPEILG